MSTRLIVNADDLGLSAAIDNGIFRAHREGIVTSATLLVTSSTARAAVQKARAEGLAVGVHLCLATNLPPAAPASLVRTSLRTGASVTDGSSWRALMQPDAFRFERLSASSRRSSIARMSSVLAPTILTRISIFTCFPECGA